MERSYITFAQAQAAMNAMLEAAQKRPEQPVAIAIVDDAGHMVAYHQMDNLTVFARRHSIRKAYTGAITGRNSGEFGEWMKSRGMTVRELGGDLELTPGLGGVVIRARSHAAGDVPRERHGRHRGRRVPVRPGRRRPRDDRPEGNELVAPERRRFFVSVLSAAGEDIGGDLFRHHDRGDVGIGARDLWHQRGVDDS